MFEYVKALLDERLPGHSLPGGLYSSDAVLDVDLHAIYYRSWLFVAFTIELPSAGEYLALNIGPTPIILIRNRAGEVKGYFNTCRHRGAQIKENGSGKCGRLTCPYHQWSYDLDGRLVGARGMGQAFDKDALGLRPIAVEEVAGTIYVCLSDTPPDFAPFKAAFEPMAERYNMADLKIVHRQTIVEKANWKLAMENARECAHCSVGHPELSRSLVDVITFDYDSPNTPMAQEFIGLLDRQGISLPVEGDWFWVGHVPLKHGVKAMSVDLEPSCKKPIAEGLENLGYFRWALQPHCYNVALSDYIFTFSAIPVGPETTIIESKWLVHKDAVEGVDYDPERVAELWKLTNIQDIAFSENNQLGVNSFGYRPGPYIPGEEAWCEKFVDWYCEKARAFIAAG